MINYGKGTSALTSAQELRMLWDSPLHIWSMWTPSVVHLESAYHSRLPDHLEKTLPDLHFRYHFHTQNLRFSQMFILKVYSRCPVAGLLGALLPWQCIIIIKYNIFFFYLSLSRLLVVVCKSAWFPLISPLPTEVSRNSIPPWTPWCCLCRFMSAHFRGAIPWVAEVVWHTTGAPAFAAAVWHHGLGAPVVEKGSWHSVYFRVL